MTLEQHSGLDTKVLAFLELDFPAYFSCLTMVDTNALLKALGHPLSIPKKSILAAPPYNARFQISHFELPNSIVQMFRKFSIKFPTLT
jgi:hypothetical protein